MHEILKTRALKNGVTAGMLADAIGCDMSQVAKYFRTGEGLSFKRVERVIELLGGVVSFQHVVQFCACCRTPLGQNIVAIDTDARGWCKTCAPKLEPSKKLRTC